MRRKNPAGVRKSVNCIIFSAAPVEGTFEVAGPSGWRVNFAKDAKIPPEERLQLTLTVEAAGTAAEGETVRIQGAFGPAGKPILSLRLAPESK
jgi:hypothetical protein